MDYIVYTQTPRLLGHTAMRDESNGDIYIVGGYSDLHGFNFNTYVWKPKCNRWLKYHQDKGEFTFCFKVQIIFICTDLEVGEDQGNYIASILKSSRERKFYSRHAITRISPSKCDCTVKICKKKISITRTSRTHSKGMTFDSLGVLEVMDSPLHVQILVKTLSQWYLSKTSKFSSILWRFFFLIHFISICSKDSCPYNSLNRSYLQFYKVEVDIFFVIPCSFKGPFKTI